MRITKMGKKISYEVEKKCHSCGTIFMINLLDTHSNSNNEYVFCPNCKKVIDVSRQEMQKMMKRYGA